MLGTASRRAVSFASAQCKHVARAGGAVPVEGTGRRAASFVKGEANPEQDVSELYEYPRRKFNFGVNTCEQGHNHVVQRFGKFKRVVTSGLYFALPFIDTIVTHDMRERTVLISPQSGVTRDNVCVRRSALACCTHTHMWPGLGLVLHTRTQGVAFSWFCATAWWLNARFTGTSRCRACCLWR